MRRQWQYKIMYDYREYPKGMWGFNKFLCTDTLISCILHFVWLRLKYRVLSIDYIGRDLE